MARNLPEHSEHFHSHGLHLPTRTVFIDGDETDDDFQLTAKSARRDIKNLHVLDSLGTGTINVILNCWGGDTVAGMAVYDAIKGCKNHVIITVQGRASSMGSIILQAADERVMAPNSLMLVHMGEVEYVGRGSEVDSERKFDKHMDEVHKKIYLDRIKQKKPRFTMEKLQSILDSGSFMTAQEAVEMGLADRISGDS